MGPPPLMAIITVSVVHEPRAGGPCRANHFRGEIDGGWLLTGTKVVDVTSLEATGHVHSSHNPKAAKHLGIPTGSRHEILLARHPSAQEMNRARRCQQVFFTTSFVRMTA